jgi:hypothetical protein
MRRFAIVTVSLMTIATGADGQQRGSFTVDEKVNLVRCIYQQMFIQKAAAKASFDIGDAARRCGSPLPQITLNSPSPNQQTANPRLTKRQREELQAAKEKTRFVGDELKRAASLYEEVARQDQPSPK